LKYQHLSLKFICQSTYWSVQNPGGLLNKE
jgi:hypothetical protein